MNKQCFNDLTDALGEVVSGLTAIVNLPKTERERMCQILDLSRHRSNGESQRNRD